MSQLRPLTGGLSLLLVGCCTLCHSMRIARGVATDFRVWTNRRRCRKLTPKYPGNTPNLGHFILESGGTLPLNFSLRGKRPPVPPLPTPMRMSVKFCVNSRDIEQSAKPDRLFRGMSRRLTQNIVNLARRMVYVCVYVLCVAALRLRVAANSHHPIASWTRPCCSSTLKIRKL